MAAIPHRLRRRGGHKLYSTAGTTRSPRANASAPLFQFCRWPWRMIHVCDLVKAYSDLRRGELLAVAGVSFHARPGEILGLLGPNGAGKTSVLRILATILRPTSGSASI